MRDFKASAITDLFGLVWVPETIEKMRGTSPEEREPHARTTRQPPKKFKSLLNLQLLVQSCKVLSLGKISGITYLGHYI